MKPQAMQWLPYDGEAWLYTHFYSADESSELFANLLKEIPWEEKEIKIFGKAVMQPRLVSWHGDSGCAYTYSGVRQEPKAWTTTLKKIKSHVTDFAKEPFNSVLANLYRDNKDSMGAHRDNEKELGVNPVIASVSFGARRPFIFRHTKSKEIVKLILEPGSLLVMKEETQLHWKHELPKLSQFCEPRINLTFRNIVSN